MQVRLEVSHNKANVKRVVLQSDAIIGRSPDCNLRIASNQVSRQHCKIIITETEVFVRDLESSNGTFVSGEPIPPQKDVRIASGTQLSIGPANFVVRYDSPAVGIEPSTPAYPPVNLNPNEPASTVEIPVITDQAALADQKAREKGKGKPKVVPGTAAASAALQKASRAAEQVAPPAETVASAAPAGSADEGPEPEEVFLTPGMNKPGSTVLLTPVERADEPASESPPVGEAASLGETVRFKAEAPIAAEVAGSKNAVQQPAPEAAEFIPPVGEPVAEEAGGAFNFLEPKPPQAKEVEDSETDEEYEDEDEEYEDEDEEESQEDEARPRKKRGGIFSLFGLFGGKRKRVVDEEDEYEDDESEDEEEYEDEEQDEEEVDQSAPPAAATDSPQKRKPARGQKSAETAAAKAQPAAAEASEEDVASFLSNVDSEPDAAGEDDELGDFLKQLGN